MENINLEMPEMNLDSRDHKFNILFDLSPMAIVLSKFVSGTLVDVNERFLGLTLYDREELIGKTATGLVFFTPDVRKHFVQALAKQGEIRHFEMNLRIKDGSTLNTLVFARILGAGDDPHILSVVQDRSDDRRLRQKLLQAQKMEFIGTLAAGIAHDLNNYLLGIDGSVTLLKQDINDSHPCKTMLQEIHGYVEACTQLTRQLLGYARKGRNKIGKLDLNRLISETSNAFLRSRKVLEGIAGGFTSEDVGHIDLTLPEDARQTIASFSDELVIFGAPVYGGRLPVDAIERFKRLKADKTPAVIIVVYGNREYEDALLELKHLAIELGFNPIAGGAFIGEHSFATKDGPIANGRPDSQDLQLAMDFGAKIKEKAAAMQPSDAPVNLKVSGRFPFAAGGARPMVVSPVTNGDTCTLCGTCVSVCPTSAISMDESVATETDRCIRCCACIKSCPAGARRWNDAMMEKIANLLSQFCRYPKEPRFFGVDM